MQKKSPATPKLNPRKPATAAAASYVLTLRFNPQELQRIEALEANTGLRRTALIRFLLAEEARRRGIA